jgi:hypothetical protein
MADQAQAMQAVKEAAQAAMTAATKTMSANRITISAVCAAQYCKRRS